jgi:hypothetical protein
MPHRQLRGVLLPRRNDIKVRALRMVGVLALTSLALSACSFRHIGTESFETAIPKALEASDLGIVSAEASRQMSGIAITVSVWAEFESDTVTADDLKSMLEIAVDNANQSGLHHLDITALVGPYAPDGDNVFIDLGSVGEQLGFEKNQYNNLTDFSADWDNVVAYLDEQ